MVVRWTDLRIPLWPCELGTCSCLLLLRACQMERNTRREFCPPPCASCFAPVGQREVSHESWERGVCRRELIIPALTSARGSVRQRRLPGGRAREEEQEERGGGGGGGGGEAGRGPPEGSLCQVTEFPPAAGEMCAALTGIYEEMVSDGTQSGACLRTVRKGQAR
ncbi:hypothetical protein GN956_G21757 [Arapaima gigas]